MRCSDWTYGASLNRLIGRLMHGCENAAGVDADEAERDQRAVDVLHQLFLSLGAEEEGVAAVTIYGGVVLSEHFLIVSRVADALKNYADSVD